FRPGDQINISNSVPYARRIESDLMKMSVPGHIYEDSVQIVAARYGNQANVRFVFMPVRFGSVDAYANSLAGQAMARISRGGRVQLHSEWLSRQPAMEITAR
ncbi:hypothetical protein G3V73_23860, partial [Escherichia coli]|nr:hypothetical protein [Escherichia coli]